MQKIKKFLILDNEATRRLSVVIMKDFSGQLKQMITLPAHLANKIWKTINKGNKLGMTKVFGEDFVMNGTSSCSYHINISIKGHSNLVSG